MPCAQQRPQIQASGGNHPPAEPGAFVHEPLEGAVGLLRAHRFAPVFPLGRSNHHPALEPWNHAKVVQERLQMIIYTDQVDMIAAHETKLKFLEPLSEFALVRQALGLVLGCRFLPTVGSAGSARGRAVASRWRW